MCLFCDVRLNTIRELRKEIRELERMARQHETELKQCKLCEVKALKHPERRYYWRERYQANREAILAKAKVRNERKRAGAVTGP